MTNQNQSKFNGASKGISTPIGILVIVVLAGLVGGIAVWQQRKIQTEEIGISHIKLPKQEITKEIKTANKETKELDLDYKGMLQQMFPGGKLIQTKNR